MGRFLSQFLLGSPSLRSPLLSHSIKWLKLSTTKPWPSESHGGKEMIKQWRAEQRCKLIKGERNE